ncbi:MAG: phosphoribosylformylglycinamidine synthase subunit PurL [Verrucomicrobiaceae bacterium]|nr:phosphoribosylformylglycinamidine synthase subunit PurL [Verrucomicrobiaceae bacterium]
MSPDQPAENFRRIEIRDLEPEGLGKLSEDMKLSLSIEDMIEIQLYYASEMRREPTDVELECIAQTWSEHCKHRIFGARIEHCGPDGEEVINGLFKTYIKEVTERIMETKPGFVLGCFVDNAGFIKLDDNQAVCLKVETHNHPSAIEPYAGANTGLGGVIRDILGAGKGAKPIASCDIFCFGPPDIDSGDIQADDVIHPLGIMRGVVRGVRDYGNRMGIPTISGAVQFDPSYIYNPLVFCGTAGVIPIDDIDKQMRGGLKIIAVGGRTGRDGLKGATFSSMALDTDSHEADQQAVQIGNPIEEKKAADFVLDARRGGLVVFITDCGAGGFSSAAGEMLSEVGGNLYLDRAPLKEPGMTSWEIFLSESQERMVLAVEESALPELRELAETYETELTDIGESDHSGILKVWHDGELVCELDNSRLHDAPVRQMSSEFVLESGSPGEGLDCADLVGELGALLSDFAVCSREPIIREYDHEVQGNTVLKPLAGASGDAPQDASVVRIDGSDQLMAMGLALLPEWGKSDPRAMGRATVDECMRSLVVAGANPDRIALLDNFCVGNPDNSRELGMLVETCKGIAEAAEAYGAPFVSGKDSFYNYFETEQGAVSIPTTCLISGMGIVEEQSHVTGASIRKPGSLLAVVGCSGPDMGGSVYARIKGVFGGQVPHLEPVAAMNSYRGVHQAISRGLILAAHDISEGGLAVAAAEMGFSLQAGLEIDLDALPAKGSPEVVARLFGEAPSRILIELDEASLSQLEELFNKTDFAVIGSTSSDHSRLRFTERGESVLDAELVALKEQWKNGLKHYY